MKILKIMIFKQNKKKNFKIKMIKFNKMKIHKSNYLNIKTFRYKMIYKISFLKINLQFMKIIKKRICMIMIP